MKKAKLILLVISFLVPTFLSAQTIELNVQSHQLVSINNVHAYSGEKWFLGGNANSAETSDWYFMSIDSLIKANPTDNLNGFKNVVKVIRAGSGGYAIIKDDKTHLVRFAISLNSDHSTTAMMIEEKHTFDDDVEILNLKNYVSGNIAVLGRKIVNGQEKAFVQIFRYNLDVKFTDYLSNGYFNYFTKLSDSTFIATGNIENGGYGGKKYSEDFEDFLIFPNPLNNLMKVSLKEAPFDPTLIEFYDYLGREIEPKYFIAPRAKYKEIDISSIPAGFYFLRISNDLIEKVVKVYVD